MIIYMATNKINGKSYIGKTINSLKQRKQEHIRDARNKRHNSYFHNTLRKYGFDSCNWIILDRCEDLDILNRLEIYYINLYKTFEKGMNLTFGGDGGSHGRKCSEETKQKISNSKKGANNYFHGKKHTLEAKLKISVGKKGRCIGKNNSMYGKKHSEVSRKLMSEKLKGNSSGAKAVIINGKYFSTQSRAAKYLNVTQHTIGRRIKNKDVGYSYA